MKLSFYPYTLKLKDTFTISHHSRTTTPIVLTEIEHEGIIGYGEASLPPYLNENQQSVINFLKKVNLEKYSEKIELDEILIDISKIDEGNYAAKASIDIALHDIFCKMKKIPLYKYFNLNDDRKINTSITIGIDTENNVIKKVEEYSDYKILKFKLGAIENKKIIEAVRKVTNIPFTVDFNQAWGDKILALEIIEWLADKNVILVEQPLKKEMIDEMAWLTERSPVPIFADEMVQSFSDLNRVNGACNGVNIKLMKCGGIYQVKKMIDHATKLGLSTMMGCMTETSCAITAASHLALMTNFADLDGAQLIKNDLFMGVEMIDGEMVLPNLPGIGVRKINI